VIDDDGAAGGQGDPARIGALDLVLDLEAREQRHVVAVQLHLADVARHHGGHERLRLLEDLVGVDQDLADVGLEVVADGADHQARLEVDEERLLRLIRPGALDRGPQLHQVVEVPGELLAGAADRGGARDDAHAFGQLQLVERVAQLVAVLALDAARDAAAPRVVRHQDQIASSKADERGEGGALGAAFLFLHLHHQLLPLREQLADVHAPALGRLAEVVLGDFLERQEPVARGAVVDEAGFERRLYAGDLAFIDVGLFLFAGGELDTEIEELLSINQSDPQLFLLSCIDEHSFHVPLLESRGPASGRRDDAEAARGCPRGGEDS
jgi:hypothetical protein